MIGTKFYPGKFEDNDYFQAATWCNANNATIIDKGDYFEVVALPDPTPQEQAEALQSHYTDLIQKALDDFARTRKYDGIMSACSYFNSTDPIFKAEADYCIELRDTTWRMGYQLLDEVLAGERAIPTEAELMNLLPVGSAKWPEIDA